MGISCVFSAFAGMAAGRLASAGGQFKLLLAAALSLATITAIVALAVQDTPDGVGCNKPGNTVTKMKNKRVAKKGQGGLLTVLGTSASLFRRSSLLAALLAEAVVCQVLMATLSMSFNLAIRQSLAPHGVDTGAQAAGFVGKSFAFVGLLSGALQMVVMPWAMLRINPSFLLTTLPLVAASGCLFTFVSPGFRTATAAFAVTKILDYSVRGTALELVYQAMPEHERLLGKEAIATVGVRIGRTAAHVTLYCCSALMQSSASQRGLMSVALTAAVLWAIALRRVEVLARCAEEPPHHPSEQRPQHQLQSKLSELKLSKPKLAQRCSSLDVRNDRRSKTFKLGATAAGYSSSLWVVIREVESIFFANSSRGKRRIIPS